MSTKCQIGFYTHVNATTLESPDAMLYVHDNGYPAGPDGILHTIRPMLASFAAARGFFDSEYCAAYIVGRLMHGKVLGYGVTQSLHADIAYYYAVGACEIHVYETGYATGEVDFASMTLVQTVTW